MKNNQRIQIFIYFFFRKIINVFKLIFFFRKTINVFKTYFRNRNKRSKSKWY